MIEEGYDLVIRVDPAPDDALVGRAFLHDRLVVVAAPDMPRQKDSVVPAVVRGRDAAPSWSLSGGERLVTMAADPVLRLSSLVMIRDAVRAGAGAAQLPLSLVSRDIGAGAAGALGRHRGIGHRALGALPVTQTAERPRIRLPGAAWSDLSAGYAGGTRRVSGWVSSEGVALHANVRQPEFRGQRLPCRPVNEWQVLRSGKGPVSGDIWVFAEEAGGRS